MRMTLSSWSIRNPIPAILLFFVLVFAGVKAFMAMPVSNMPSLALPIITVTVIQPGASPEETEARITRKVENSLSSLQGIKHIWSEVSSGVSVTTIQFHLKVNVDRAFTETQSAISSARSLMPQNIEEPLVERMEIDGGAVAVYTISSPEEAPEDLSYYIDNELGRDLMTIPGVAQVQRMGGVDREITVSLRPDRLAAFGISAASLSRTLESMHENAPGGRFEVYGREYMLRALASSKSVEELRRMSLPIGPEGSLRLGDIADITDGAAEPRSISRLDGLPVTSFAVYRTKEASEIDIVRQVDSWLERVTAESDGRTFTKVFSIAKFTEDVFSAAIRALLEGIVLTVAVIFLFLREGRSTFIAALAIPLSIIPTFAVMHFLGFNLNNVSMLAISLVTGVLVDDAIVEIENIHRHIARGGKAYTASIIAADEIGLAVVATTAVICAVFTPVSFMPHIIGQFFIQFGLTVAIAAAFSLLVARTLVPMLCAYLLKDISSSAVKTHKEGRILAAYKQFVAWSLLHRGRVMAAAGLVLVGSFALIPFIAMGFVPRDDLSQSIMRLEMPYGSTLEQTDRMANDISSYLRTLPEVTSVLTTVNGGMAGQHGVHEATIEINLVPIKERTKSAIAFEHFIAEKISDIPDIRICFLKEDGQKDLSFSLISNEPEALLMAAEVIEREMRDLPGLTGVSSSAGHIQPEIKVHMKTAQAAELGVTTRDVSNALLVATIGDIDALLPYFSDGGRQIPIRVRLPKTSAADLDTLRNLPVTPASGMTVSLSAVADLEMGSGPASIKRYDWKRTVNFEANLDGIALGDAMSMIMALPSIQNLPPGVSLEQTGEVEVMEEMNEGFIFAASTGLILVYAVQVLLYKDWLQPLTRMAALPLSIGGAFLLLLITGMELGMPAIIGMLTLMAIADKNSILLVDYMLDKLREGVPRREAILEGCAVRARPIIMTSLAMMAGMFPIVLGLGESSAFRGPMAVAVIGGIISSTALSLIFVPVLFSLVLDLEEWLFPKLRKLVFPSSGGSRIREEHEAV